MIRLNALSGFQELKDIYSLDTQNRIVSSGKNGSNIKLRLNSSGYLSASLQRKDGRYMTVLYHRVIACAVVPNPECLEDVNHKDENKLNNSPENLEWVSHADNCAYGTRVERFSKKLMKPVKQINLDGCVVAIYPGVISATRAMGLSSKSAITNCISGISKSYAGFRWEYA